MVLILDTNVFIYASRMELPADETEQQKQADCRRLIERIAFVGCEHTVELSQEIENEYFNTKQGPRPQGVRGYVSDILYRRLDREHRIRKSIPPKLPASITQALRDRDFDFDDDKFVQLAVGENIKLIVSEDSDYLQIQTYLKETFGIEILTAAEALEKLF